jgi:hypothetical protein
MARTGQTAEQLEQKIQRRELRAYRNGARREEETENRNCMSGAKSNAQETEDAGAKIRRSAETMALAGIIGRA